MASIDPNSIVDYLNSKGQSSSFSNRTKLAAQYGIANYTGTAAQNTQLLNTLKSSTGSRDIPSPTPTTSATITLPRPPAIPETAPQPEVSDAEASDLLVAYLKSKGMPFNYADRAKLAEQFGISQYVSRGTENTLILNKLKSGEAPQTATSPTTTTDSPGGNDTLLNSLEQYIQGLSGKGLMINPNVAITPEQIAAFATQAASEIHPFFGNQLKTYTESFQREQGLVPAQYERNLRDIGDSFASMGFAQSGKREEKERLLTEQTQYQAGTAARSFASDFGASNLPTAPTLNAPGTSASPDSRSLPLYNLSDSVYQGLQGTQQFAETAATKSRASELEGAFRGLQATPQPRTITL